MTTQIDALLESLRRHIPRLRRNMNTFYPEFEARACRILALDDSPDTEQRLLDLLRESGHG